MAEIVTGERQATIDPLKHSQPLGGALVFLGLAGSLPIMHGAQGCASFAKALLTRHFNEPIPLQTTAITEVTAVLGSGEAMVETLDAIRKKQRPEIIGLLTTGVTEVSGEDVGGQLRKYLSAWNETDSSGPEAGANGSAPGRAPLIVGVSTPDFIGGLSDGWSAALEALVRAVVPAEHSETEPSEARYFTGRTAFIAASAPVTHLTTPGSAEAARSTRSTRSTRSARSLGSAEAARSTRSARSLGSAARRVAAADGGALDPRQLAVLVGPSLTAADLDELGELIRAFGLDPVLVPDLSGSVDGHLAPAWQPTTTGGTGLARLRALGRSRAVLVAGATAAAAGDLLAARTGARILRHRHLSGLTEMDTLVTELIELTGASAPARVRQARARLADGLLDTHFVLGGARVALAMEPETLVAVGSLLHDVGAEVVAAVSPTAAPVLADAPWDEVVVGDLTDLAERARAGGAHLVLGSSHAREVADRIGAAHLPVGFPIFDRLGAALAGTAGYAGSLRLLIDAANRLLDHEHVHRRSGRRFSVSGADGQPAHRTEIPTQPGSAGESDQLDNLFQESPC
ncbi:nitrogenase component 1 [Frankia casuarinae]|uniref:nitrogenase component 1 n=1 Tax=Frankia casuarinae (strain DSM 45818 / CECT 9043 / HFP020203 / CcI3) TaxID=106370 RepID=UPI0007BEFC78|nr:nitrogenase component 1 [Frankia casuarinae]OAA30772.1 nitrogenase molybdenum-iron protein NifN [Frankia casuarinae]